MSRYRSVVVIASLGVFGTALSACGNSGNQIAVLEDDAASEAALPVEVQEISSIRGDSVRELGSADGVDCYVAWLDDESYDTGAASACLVSVATEENWVSGCGTLASETVVELHSGISSSMLLIDGADTASYLDQGWEQVSENLLVR